MATRMTTLLYGAEPECDVAPGNRADTLDIDVPAPAPMRPRFPTPNPDPWLAKRERAHAVALPAIMFGIAAAAAIFAGLAIVGIALAWRHSMAPLAQVALMASGGYVLCVGIGYVASRPSRDHLGHA